MVSLSSGTSRDVVLEMAVQVKVVQVKAGRAS